MQRSFAKRGALGAARPDERRVTAGRLRGAATSACDRYPDALALASKASIDARRALHQTDSLVNQAAPPQYSVRLKSRHPSWAGETTRTNRTWLIALLPRNAALQLRQRSAPCCTPSPHLEQRLMPGFPCLSAMNEIIPYGFDRRRTYRALVAGGPRSRSPRHEELDGAEDHPAAWRHEARPLAQERLDRSG